MSTAPISSTRQPPPVRAVQTFTDEYLAYCRRMTPDQIAQFLDDFRQVAAGRRVRRKSISIRIQEPLLLAFKQRAKALGIPYQTQIQRLMEAWLRGD